MQGSPWRWSHHHARRARAHVVRFKSTNLDLSRHLSHAKARQFLACFLARIFFARASTMAAYLLPSHEQNYRIARIINIVTTTANRSENKDSHNECIQGSRFWFSMYRGAPIACHTTTLQQRRHSRQSSHPAAGRLSAIDCVAYPAAIPCQYCHKLHLLNPPLELKIRYSSIVRWNMP